MVSYWDVTIYSIYLRRCIYKLYLKFINRLSTRILHLIRLFILRVCKGKCYSSTYCLPAVAQTPPRLICISLSILRVLSFIITYTTVYHIIEHLTLKNIFRNKKNLAWKWNREDNQQTITELFLVMSKNNIMKIYLHIFVIR